MGYRSVVAFKTTTEGWLIFKRFNDSITNKSEQPLDCMDIQKTESGFYKISHDDIKWYESYKNVANFIKAMKLLDDQEIPYSFVRIGEDYNDAEIRQNYTSDMPDELAFFKPNIELYDENEGDYTEVKLYEEDDTFTSSSSPRDKIKEILFTAFEECPEADDVKDYLRNLHSNDELTDKEYDECLDRWDTVLAEWVEVRRSRS